MEPISPPNETRFPTPLGNDLDCYLKEKYPQEWPMLTDEVISLVLTLNALELANAKIDPNVKFGTPIIPPEKRTEVLKSIADQFASFVQRTRQEAPGWQYKGNPVRDTQEDINRRVLQAEKGGGLNYDWQDEVIKNPVYTEPFKKLISQEPSYRSIRAVGLLLSLLLKPNLSNAAYNLSKKDMAEKGVTTVDGNPADVACNILKTAGCQLP